MNGEVTLNQSHVGGQNHRRRAVRARWSCWTAPFRQDFSDPRLNSANWGDSTLNQLPPSGYIIFPICVPPLAVGRVARPSVDTREGPLLSASHYS